MSNEILVVPAFGQGHLFPAMELCNLLSARNYVSTLVIFPHHSPSVPSSFRNLPLHDVVDVPSPPPAEQGSDFRSQHQSSLHQMLLALEDLLSTRPRKPLCAVVDVLAIFSNTAEVFQKFGVPMVGFFTSGAASAALEYASWKANPENMKPGEIRLLPGLPDDMGLTVSDLKRRTQGPPRGGGGGGGPIGGGNRKPMMLPRPGEQPPWVEDAEQSIALIINTCDDLERPFIRYIAEQIGKPVWGVGPLVSEQYWKSAGSIVHETRPNKQSSVSDDKVIQWLNSKPRGSVLYVAFGSSVVPTAEEHAQLADALGESTWPFIWVIQPGSGKPGNSRALFAKPGSDTKEPEEDIYFANDLDSRVGDRGLIIRGWAPQLLILSHPSTGGFLSHCGWNSTMEAIGLGVPFLAWPLRGDQYYDAKLVVGHLKVGYMVSDDMSDMVKKEEIVKRIDRLMSDEETKKRAGELKSKFVDGFPKSSVASLDAFCEFVSHGSNASQLL